MNLNTSNQIGVIGAGVMGAGIAQVAAHAGHPVKLYDVSSQAQKSALSGIRSNLNRLVERGKVNEIDKTELLNRIQHCQHLADLAECELIIEAVAEDLHVKLDVLKQIEDCTTDRSILATNTSSISITAIASELKRPENFAGMHFFNPAPIMKLVEVVRGHATSDETASTIFATAQQWGKIPVFTKSTPGFIVNRAARAFYAEPLRLLEENAASIETIDTLFKDAAGFRMGPFELMDLIGHDVNYAVTLSIYNAYYQDPRFLPSLVQKELVDANALGRKTGSGFYNYPVSSENKTITPIKSDRHPEQIAVMGELGVAQPLIQRARDAGIQVKQSEGSGLIKIDNLQLALTDGRTATQLAQDTNQAETVTFDLVLDYQDVNLIGIAKADQASDQSLLEAAGFFSALGLNTLQLDDSPGLCVMRTVCMLANEAADLVYQGVCDVQSVDNAMKYGLNFPQGPLQWADQIGISLICRVLNQMQSVYGSDRYRTSLLLQRKNASNQSFYNPYEAS